MKGWRYDAGSFEHEDRLWAIEFNEVKCDGCFFDEETGEREAPVVRIGIYYAYESQEYKLCARCLRRMLEDLNLQPALRAMVIKRWDEEE